MQTQPPCRCGPFLTACAVVALVALLALMGWYIPNASAIEPGVGGGGSCEIDIDYFYPSSSTIDEGQNTTLHWQVQVPQGCTVYVDLSGSFEVDGVVGLTGSKTAHPLSTTTYTLTATLWPQLSEKIVTTKVTVNPLSSEIPVDCPIHVYLGNNPSGTDLPDWSDKANGIANDGQHWFFTNQTALFKYGANWWPVDGDDSGKIAGVGFPPELKSLDINHFGDPDYYAGYVFVPFEDEDATTVIGAFRASDLAFVDWVDVSDFQTRAGWVAIDPVEQLLYTSQNKLVAGTPLLRYEVDVSKLENGIPGDFLTSTDPIAVLDADGSLVSGQFIYMQGGVFTPWGDLYLAVGKHDDSPENTRGGLHLFRRTSDGSAFRLVESSVNVSGHVGDSVFAYEYHPGYEWSEEPEGIDWWDRDVPDSRYSGQLHAILLDNDAGDDKIWLKHYRVDYCACAGDAGNYGDGYEETCDPPISDKDEDPLPPPPPECPDNSDPKNCHEQ